MLAQPFPERITRGAIGGPGYNTAVVEAIGGQESRNLAWPVGRHRYNVSQGIKDDADQRECDAFFRKARGRARPFLFKDWTDYTLAVADSRLVLVSGTTYQLSKVYGADEPAYEEVRSLERIRSGTLLVYSAGVLKTEGVDYTADLSTGLVTTALGTLTAACEFYVPCRFDFDQKRAALIDRQRDGSVFVQWDNIDIVEVVDE